VKPNPFRVFLWFAWTFAIWACAGALTWLVSIPTPRAVESILVWGAPVGGILGTAFAVLFIVFVARRKAALLQGAAALIVSGGVAAWFFVALRDLS
jgi:hypothetical protein